MLARLGQTWDLGGYQLRLNLDPAALLAQCDPHDLETMLWYLLENCLEVTTRSSGPGGFLELELFKTGRLPSAEEMAGLFTPFHSIKPQGTGFGLPIASLAARRNLGYISLAVAIGGGTLCLVRLPLPAAAEASADLP